MRSNLSLRYTIWSVARIGERGPRGRGVKGSTYQSPQNKKIQKVVEYQKSKDGIENDRIPVKGRGARPKFSVSGSYMVNCE